MYREERRVVSDVKGKQKFYNWKLEQGKLRRGLGSAMLTWHGLERRIGLGKKPGVEILIIRTERTSFFLWARWHVGEVRKRVCGTLPLLSVLAPEI
ncbi:hypothetical protein FCM35_KLT14618 [Carex littledalei]|uniref:Uncharacterized protein n=1 Tax=Carex littledalei TaxID=544730 RepID=A0A833QBT6_9POAL|nr:hypothetical protein FCM35_KLT14618 [Carex littledalei]